MRTVFVALLVLLGTPVAAVAYERINSQDQFVAAINNKTLSNRLYGVTLNVTANGQINGAAWGSAIAGTWSWQDGYFCRGMTWGGDDIGYNCQLVEIRGGNEMRFTSDQGTGDAASFKLR